MSPLGAALILLGCLGAAGRIVRGQRQRLSALSELSRALETMHAELSLRAAGLPELTKELAQSGRGAAGRFFAALEGRLRRLGDEPFSALWEEAAAEALPELSAADRAALGRLGQTLGRYELGEQLAALALCRSSLERSAALLSDALPERRRLAFGLLGAAGALLCICLL